MTPDTSRRLAAGLAAAAMLTPSLALAHTGIGAPHGFVHGFLHPLTGLDHVLAMVAVGVFSYRLGGRALWLVPLSFVVMMAVGGALGMAGIAVPWIEAGIALSVVVLGALVAFGVRTPVAAAMALVGLFAVFHGYAHGAEMPETAGGLGYAAGFVAATAALHAAGIGLGLLIGRLAGALGTAGYRVAGGAVSLAGVLLLAGAV